MEELDFAKKKISLLNNPLDGTHWLVNLAVNQNETNIR